ncbi:MAG: hypothetical protein LWW94_02400 [Candidatus Desulfofervidaceae bacterium]|nr:hypothetical protein [Candidatus Desulfofervidaceae bacterium]
MFAEEKLNVIREYLKTKFPDYTVDEGYEFDHSAQTFRLRRRNKMHFVIISEEFIDDREGSKIKTSLQKIPLKKYFHQEGVTCVIITNSSIRKMKGRTFK